MVLVGFESHIVLGGDDEEREDEETHARASRFTTFEGSRRGHVAVPYEYLTPVSSETPLHDVQPEDGNNCKREESVEWKKESVRCGVYLCNTIVGTSLCGLSSVCPAQLRLC